MPRPPLAACGDDSLYVCEVCGKCPTHDLCQPPPALVSINSRKAAEAIRRSIREGKHEGQHG